MATLVTEEILKDLTEDLKELAKKPKLRSLRDAITVLQPQIDQVLQLGYTVEDVAEVLAKRGLSMTPKTLKRYLAEVRTPREAKSPQTLISQESPEVKSDLDQTSAKRVLGGNDDI